MGRSTGEKKYIPFGIEVDSLRTAKPKLERIETDIRGSSKALGVRTEPLSGYERPKVLPDVFNMDTNEPFRFSFDTANIYAHLDHSSKLTSADAMLSGLGFQTRKA